MNTIKRFYWDVYRQLRIRKNLYHLRDRRAFWPFLSQLLCNAAEIWPEVLPWPPRTILDVGAHRGDIAEQLAELYHPRFIGLVEPLPQMVALLQTKSFAPQQKVFACALGRSEGRGGLNVLASLPSSSLLEINPGCDALFHRPMNKVETIEVAIRTLDSIFDECDLKSLDLLKVDVQGYEIEVFAGGAKTLQKTCLIVTEVSFFEHYKGQPMFGEIYDYLHGIGFELRGTFGYLYDSRGLPLQCDAVFINRAMPTF